MIIYLYKLHVYNDIVGQFHYCIWAKFGRMTSTIWMSINIKYEVMLLGL